jgi:hypothetical protein
MAGPEKRIEAAFAKWGRDQGLFVLKLAAQGVTGFPDRTVILPGGRLICIEFKSPTGKTSKVQDQRIAALRALGVPVLVTSELTVAKDFVKGYVDEVRSGQGSPKAVGSTQVPANRSAVPPRKDKPQPRR